MNSNEYLFHGLIYKLAGNSLDHTMHLRRAQARLMGHFYSTSHFYLLTAKG